MPGKTVCFLTRLVPEPGPTLLREGFTEVRGNFQDRRLSRDELLSGVSGVDALYCLLHDTIDAQIMDAACLLYTSDAADDLLCVDLGGRRIIKKKKKKK